MLEKSLYQKCKELGLEYDTIMSRIKKGMSEEEALKLPIKRVYGRKEIKSAWDNWKPHNPYGAFDTLEYYIERRKSLEEENEKMRRSLQHIDTLAENEDINGIVLEIKKYK